MPGNTTSEQMRVVYPLWAKLGGLFGGLVGVFIGLYGWYAFQHDLAAEEAELERAAVGLATTLAGGIDGDVHATFRTPGDMDRPEYRHVQRWLSEARVDNDIWWIGTSTRDARGHHHYVIDADLESSFPAGYPIFDGIGYRERALAGESLWVPDYEDEWGTWATAIAPIRRKDGEVVGLIEVVHDADALVLYTRSRARRLAFQILLATGLVLLTAILFTRYVNRHLGALTRAAIGVSAGDLDRRVHIDTSDEIGVLGSAFNQMVEGLQEREFIRATFGRFVDPEVVDQVLADREGLRLGGDARTVTVLMSDLRGFTAQVEQLGPTEMVAMLNRYLAAMIRVANEHKGMVAELLGDGIVVFFGAPTLRPDDALRAVRCAVDMQRELVQFNEAEGRSLEMGIGLDTGVVIAGNIGSEAHMKYGVVGDAINLAARLEGFTVGTQVLASEATAQAAGEEVALGPRTEVEVKGRHGQVVYFSVLGVGDLAMPEADQVEAVAVDVPATWWRIEGKRVLPEAHPVRVTRFALPRLVLSGEDLPEVREKVRLTLDLGEVGSAEDLYATVCSADPSGSAELHLTSVPEAAQAHLDALVARVREANG